MAYTNSPLVSYTKLSPNNSGLRTHAIDRITPHCVVGQTTVRTLGNIFSKPSRQASSNYGIGKDGKVGMYVEEKNRSWCSSSKANDQRAVTIECASDTFAPYAFNSVVYNKLIELCVDICRRNGKKKLLWLGTKEKSLSYSPKPDEMILTAHRWFSSTDCPGEWMYAREADLASKVTEKLNPKPVESKINITYQVYDNVKKKFLPNVNNNDDYAGILGNSIGCIYASLSKGNVYYKVRDKVSKKWLPEVKNRSDYAGIKGKSIDAIMFRTDTGKKIYYQVHIKGGKWLPYVTGYNEKDGNNGYAGIFGKEIDAVRMYLK